MPDFVIIGAQKCGTTYLYERLIQHSGVVSAFTKEVHFFDVNFRKGVGWYRAHFPAYPEDIKQDPKLVFITGEASPYYVFHPHVPKRLHAIAPQAKLILLLRNPVNRAYSHYHHEVRWGFETLTFEDAIEREHERLLGETEKMLGDENYYSFNHEHYSYLARGIYVDQLKNWMKVFPQEQLLILKSEDFYNDTPSIMKRVTDFLKLPSYDPEEYGRPTSSPYPKMDASMRKYLIDYFGPHNQRLYDYLGVNFGWDE
jgi:hypothetical protein